MTSTEKVRALVGAGFKLMKDGSRHSLYAKNGVVVPVPKGNGENPRAVKSLRAAIRRADRGAAVAPGRYV